MVLVVGSDGWWDYRVKLKILEGGILNTLHSEFSDTTAPLRNKDEQIKWNKTKYYYVYIIHTILYSENVLSLCRYNQ